MLYLLFALLSLIASAEIVCTEACTRTQGYWKTHNSQRTTPSQNTPWSQTAFLPQGENTLICGTTALEWMFVSPSKNPYAKFAHQYIAALNNLGRGACHAEHLYMFNLMWNDYIVPAAGYCQCAERGACSDPNNEFGRELTYYASFLDGYNNGHNDISTHCDDDNTTPPGGPGEPINCGTETCRFVKICEIEYQPQCEPQDPTCEGGCTYTRGCWTYNSQGDQPCPAIVQQHLAELNSRSVCGFTWTQILGYNTTSALGDGKGPVNSNTWYKLAIQTLSALLNVEYSGACTTIPVESDIAAALDIIENCAYAYPNDVSGSVPLADANRLMNDLALFNEGERGPVHC